MRAINIYELKRMFAKNEPLQLIDIRNTDEYSKDHIQDAINFPKEKLKENISEISKDKKVIIYCNYGSKSIITVNWLVEKGYNNVYYLEDGFYEWTTSQEK